MDEAVNTTAVNDAHGIAAQSGTADNQDLQPPRHEQLLRTHTSKEQHLLFHNPKPKNK